MFVAQRDHGDAYSRMKVSPTCMFALYILPNCSDLAVRQTRIWNAFKEIMGITEG
jgi:hypothetical protein